MLSLGAALNLCKRQPLYRFRSPKVVALPAGGDGARPTVVPLTALTSEAVVEVVEGAGVLRRMGSL